MDINRPQTMPQTEPQANPRIAANGGAHLNPSLGTTKPRRAPSGRTNHDVIRTKPAAPSGVRTFTEKESAQNRNAKQYEATRATPIPRSTARIMRFSLSKLPFALPKRFPNRSSDKRAKTNRCVSHRKIYFVAVLANPSANARNSSKYLDPANICRLLWSPRSTQYLSFGSLAISNNSLPCQNGITSSARP